MQLFPFFRKRYSTDIKSEELLDRLKKNVKEPSWTLEVNLKPLKKQLIVGKIKHDSFLLGGGSNCLTYGIGGFYPLLQGRLKSDSDTGNTLLIIIIRLSFFTLGILIFFYVIAIIGVYTATQKNMHEVLIICSLFIINTYLVVMFCFNRLKKKYLSFIDQILIKK